MWTFPPVTLLSVRFSAQSPAAFDSPDSPCHRLWYTAVVMGGPWLWPLAWRWHLSSTLMTDMITMPCHGRGLWASAVKISYRNWKFWPHQRCFLLNMGTPFNSSWVPVRSSNILECTRTFTTTHMSGSPTLSYIHPTESDCVHCVQSSTNYIVLGLLFRVLYKVCCF